MKKTGYLEDTPRKSQKAKYENRYSPYCDLIYYDSSVTTGIKLAMLVRKPAKKGYILSATHGWHTSIPDYEPEFTPDTSREYLTIDIDMRGRANSQGYPDCNGLELIDVIDAIEYTKHCYSDFLIDTENVYFEASSGGGGNAFSLATKFPDYFSAITSLCGISDYETWYREDIMGEFRDELDVWIHCTPDDNPMAYAARSSLTGIGNLRTPIFIAHGSTDERCSVEYSRRFVKGVQDAAHGDLVRYFELPGVGTSDHWSNATPEQLVRVTYESEQNRKDHRTPVGLEDSGKLVVAGYLYTKKFIIMLESIDYVGTVEYNLRENLFNVDAPCKYQITIK